MAHVIGNFDILPKAPQRTQILSCIRNPKEQLRNKIYDAEDIQKRINEAAKVRARLDYEIKKRDENIKNINFLG